MDTIATIIVHYNTPIETVTCLRSVLKLKTESFHHQIVVIDNGSKENLVLPDEINNQVVLLRSDANMGFAGGNNFGIRFAIQEYDPNYLMLLNSDTTVSTSSYEQLLSTMRTRPEVGMINPKIYFSPGHEFHKTSYQSDQIGKVLWYAGGTVDWADIVSFHRGVDEVDRKHFDHVSDTDFTTGCCLLIRREVIESVGLLSEDLFLYWEDVEYSLRVKAEGYQIAFDPKAVIWHDNAGSSDGAGSVVGNYYQTRNRLYLAFHYGPFQAKKAAIRLVLKYLQGNEQEQRAVWDALTGQMGKQAVV